MSKLPRICGTCAFFKVRRGGEYTKCIYHQQPAEFQHEACEGYVEKSCGNCVGYRVRGGEGYCITHETTARAESAGCEAYWTKTRPQHMQAICANCIYYNDGDCTHWGNVHPLPQNVGCRAFAHRGKQ